jgi:hypothetical protein
MLAEVRVAQGGQASTKVEDDDADECLHCVIMELVEERVAAGDADLGIIVARIAESLVDVILRVPVQDQAKLLAHTLTALGDLFLEKSTDEEGGSSSTH